MEKQFWKRWEGKPVRVIEVSVGDPDWWLLGYTEEYGLEMPIYFTESQNKSQVCLEYKINELTDEQFDIVFLLDADGIVRYKDSIREEISWETLYTQADHLLEGK